MGGSDQNLRYLGFFVGIGITVALWITGWSIKKAPPVLALVLFGLSPVALVWGDSLRAYGFGCVWNILAIGLIWKLVCERPRTSDILFATLAALLSVHSLFPNAFFLLAAGLGAIVVAARHRWWRTVFIIVGLGLTTGLSLLPYVPIIRASQNWTGLAKAGIGVGWIFHVLFEALHAGGSTAAILWIGCAMGACAALIVGLVRPRQLPAIDRNCDLMVYAGLTFLVAAVSIVSFFRVVGWTTSVWYYVPLMATAAVCFDAITAIFRKGAASVIVNSCLSVLAAIFLVPFAYRASEVRLTNADLVTEEIAGHAERSDLIVVDNYFYAISFNRYYHGQTPWVSVPDLKDLTLHRWDLLTDTMRKPQPIEPVLEEIDRTLKEGHNVFVVGFAPTKRPNTPPPELPPAPPANSGWILWPYMGTWTRQIAYATQSHARRGMIISVPCQQPVSIAEHLNAFVVSGWRDQE